MNTRTSYPRRNFARRFVRHNIVRRSLALILTVCLCLSASLCFTACSGGLGEPLMELDGQSLTVNMYRLLLSRVKGNLARNGYQVSSDSFWNTVVSSDGTTYDEYCRQLALMDLKEYLAAAVLFDEMGLSLSKAEKDAIDEEIDSLIKERANGSKSTLNSTLSEYGANIDILRAMYTLEAKYAAVLTALYGSDGSQIADSVLQEYLDTNGLCFRQLLIRSYTYVYETDLNGDDIYYVVNENNGKVSNIAYDTIHGNSRTDEFGKTIVDKNGDTVYYTADGRISYDKTAGVRAYVYDQDGNPQTKKYSADQIAAQREDAIEILATAATLGTAGFESLLEEYSDGSREDYIASQDYCFLYATHDNGTDYLNDIADAVSELKVGEATMLDTEYGCHIVMRYTMPADAVTNEAYDEWFTDLVTRVADQLFEAKIAPYVARITVDDDVYASVSSIREVGINFYY